VQAVQGRQPTPLPAAVLDVVVDQEGVVGELDGYRRAQGLVHRAPERPAGRQQQRRADPLAGP
jgi:hypothetical protein